VSRVARRIAAIACASLLAGCGATGAYPLLHAQRTLSAGCEPLDDAGIERLLAAAPNVPPDPRAALLVIDRYSGPGSLTESDRATLVELLRTRLDRPPFASVQFVPNTVVSGLGEDAAPPSLAALRAAAARMQGDLLILVDAATDSDRGSNWLAATYLALLPIAFVPGNQAAAWASGEACAIDVRSGVFLGCVSGNGTARDDYVRAAQVDDALRRVVRDAVDDALATLPAHIADLIRPRTGT